MARAVLKRVEKQENTVSTETESTKDREPRRLPAGLSLLEKAWPRAERSRAERAIVESLRKAEAERAVQREALQAIAIALAEPDGGEYWTARAFLDRFDIFHDDLSGTRVLLKVAEAALGQTEGHALPYTTK